jgi:hypothetical protein
VKDELMVGLRESNENSKLALEKLLSSAREEIRELSDLLKIKED